MPGARPHHPFTPRRLLAPAALLALLVASAGCGSLALPSRDELVGHWKGSAAYRGARVGLVLDVVRGPRGLVATLSSNDLMLERVPLSNLQCVPPALRFRIDDQDAPVYFRGWVRGGAIAGALSSEYLPSGATIATGPRATFRRVPPETLAVRADTVRFAGAAPGVTLAGTLYAPRDSLAHPAVVLVHGSSVNTRESYLYDARRFAEGGFVALAYDKRGRGASSGAFGEATYDDLAADAASAIAWLRARPDVDPARVGIWGLSQGAMLAPRIAAASRAAFVVAISPPGVPLTEVIAYQDSLAGGRHSPPPAAAWLAAELTRDPSPDWRALRVPALVVFGERDVQVPAQRSAARIHAALGAGRNPDGTVIVVPRANHVIKLRPTADEPFDWPRAAPGYRERMLDWMRAHVGPPPKPPDSSGATTAQR